MSPRASARLLAKLILYHPDQAPPALLRLVSSRPPPPPPPPAPEPEPIQRHPKPIPGRPLAIHDIVEMVAWFYEMGISDLKFGGAVRLFAYPRFIAFYLARTMLYDHLGQRMSVSAIGRRFSYDHTSVIHGIRQIAAGMEMDDRLRDEIEVIRLHLLGDDGGEPLGIPQSRLSEYIKYRNGALYEKTKSAEDCP